MANILVGGIVAYRDKRRTCRSTWTATWCTERAEARSVAVDIFRQLRGGADAMIYKYFAAHDLPRRRQADGRLPNFRSQLTREGGERRVESGRPDWSMDERCGAEANEPIYLVCAPATEIHGADRSSTTLLALRRRSCRAQRQAWLRNTQDQNPVLLLL